MAASVGGSGAGGAAARASGLQRAALSLYRRFLRAIREKGPEHRDALRAHVRAEFDKGRALPRRQTERIEFFLRRGERQLELLRSPQLKSLH
jgi:succinate dehydrogenase assembly factor 1